MRINEAVGEFLRRYRAAHGLTLDDIATASRRYGSGWSAATVRDIERGGGKADSLPVILVLVQVLNSLTGEHMAVADIFELLRTHLDVESVDVMNGSALDTLTLSKIFRGERYSLKTVGGGYIQDFLGPLAGPTKQLSEGRARVALRHTPTGAERRAAAKLGVKPVAVGFACMMLYGRSLDEEAAARAGDGASPQKRGRVTRVIVGEVAAKLSEWEQRRDADMHVAYGSDDEE
ncbi:helix-turn-helix domain-containing protein [Bifidobacterium saguinibicoloris]|uniref:helix-turn-helix domain-containing protein n=1 Tax=Bifidobacterium saguinibicoloris TaxID=2834433 RepID=UPI001C5602D0|nr:helix-turn-helix transcriptional regulator [Bifidobacterium saguinibicoloris]MBW3080668.1 helix-turn-helix domain-containing protein [Bifidobacterium saguinibicoloris]